MKERLRKLLGQRRFDSLEPGRTSYLAIQNREVLRPWLSKQGLKTGIADALLHDASRLTPLERGTSADLVGISRKDGRGITFEQLGEIDEHVFDPASLAGGTRDGYEVAFRKAFTFFLSHGRIDRLLPMKVQDSRKCSLSSFSREYP